MIDCTPSNSASHRMFYRNCSARDEPQSHKPQISCRTTNSSNRSADASGFSIEKDLRASLVVATRSSPLNKTAITKSQAHLTSTLTISSRYLHFSHSSTMAYRNDDHPHVLS